MFLYFAGKVVWAAENIVSTETRFSGSSISIGRTQQNS